MNADLEAAVRDRARNTCEYCLIPQTAEITDHQIDHVIARKHAGETTLENLAVSCFHCNVHKQTDLTGIDPDTRAITPLFNQRTDRWVDHFRLLSDGSIIAKTAVGRVTVYVLKMNESESVTLRGLLIRGEMIAPTV
jgi:hypothetical protein